jgi:hypothetical protein
MMDGPISPSTSTTTPIEAIPLTSVTLTNRPNCHGSPPRAQRCMSRNCGTAPSANAMIPAASAGTSVSSAKPSRTICVIVTAIADAAVYRVKFNLIARFMTPMPPYRKGMGQWLKPFSAEMER